MAAILLLVVFFLLIGSLMGWMTRWGNSELSLWTPMMMRSNRRNDGTYTTSRHYNVSHFPQKVYVHEDDAEGELFLRTQEAIKFYNRTMNFTVFDEELELTDQPDQRIFASMYVQSTSRWHDCPDDPFDGPRRVDSAKRSSGGILAHAEYPPGDKVCVDADDHLSGPMLYRVLIHEIGHHLGLTHSQDRKSIMRDSYHADLVFTSTDIRNLQTLYPFMRK